jgi:hypothetical protein
MPNIEISKIKTRRGPDDQRKTLLFDQGELVSTTDTQRLFLGDASTLGGVSVNFKVHQPINSIVLLSSVKAERGDLIYVNNLFYQLTGANYSNILNWSNVGTKIDSNLFDYGATNTLTLKTNSISANYLASSTISNGLFIDSGVLKVNYNTTSINLSNNKLSVAASGVNEREIASSSFGNGISGGSGSIIQLKVDPTNFYFTSGVLTLSTSPFVLQFSDIQSSWIGNGLSYNGGTQKISLDDTIFSSGLVYNTTGFPILSTVLTNVDTESLVKSNLGVISISSNPSLSGTNKWAGVTVDKFGRVTNKDTAILDVLTGNSALSGYNSTSSLSAIFNGDSLGLSAITVAKFTALSANGTVITLSSAGFITFQGQTTKAGSSIDRFAIPIFRY